MKWLLWLSCLGVVVSRIMLGVCVVSFFISV